MLRHIVVQRHFPMTFEGEEEAFLFRRARFVEILAREDLPQYRDERCVAENVSSERGARWVGAVRQFDLIEPLSREDTSHPLSESGDRRGCDDDQDSKSDDR